MAAPRQGVWVGHNAGFLVVDLLAERMRGRFELAEGCGAEVLEGRLAGHRVVLAKPLSYMNDSGGPVRASRTSTRCRWTTLLRCMPP